MVFKLFLVFFSVGVGDFASAKNVLLKYEEEGILPSTRTLHYLSKELTANEIEVDFYVPKPVVQIFIINIILWLKWAISLQVTFHLQSEIPYSITKPPCSLIHKYYLSLMLIGHLKCDLWHNLICSTSVRLSLTVRILNFSCNQIGTSLFRHDLCLVPFGNNFWQPYSVSWIGVVT